MIRTFDYESVGVKYRECFFDMLKDANGKIKLSTYGYVNNDKDISHISNITVDVDENLEKDQVVIDNLSNTNIISFLLELGIVKRVVKRTIGKTKEGLTVLPVVQLDLEKLKEYCFTEEELKNVS